MGKGLIFIRKICLLSPMPIRVTGNEVRIMIGRNLNKFRGSKVFHKISRQSPYLSGPQKKLYIYLSKYTLFNV